MARNFSAYVPEERFAFDEFTDKHGFNWGTGDGFGVCDSCGDADVVLWRLDGATTTFPCTACHQSAYEAKQERASEWAMENTLYGSDEELGLA